MRRRQRQVDQFELDICCRRCGNDFAFGLEIATLFDLKAQAHRQGCFQVFRDAGYRRFDLVQRQRDGGFHPLLPHVDLEARQIDLLDLIAPAWLFDFLPGFNDGFLPRGGFAWRGLEGIQQRNAAMYVAHRLDLAVAQADAADAGLSGGKIDMTFVQGDSTQHEQRIGCAAG